MMIVILLYVLSALWGIYNVLLYGSRPSRSIGWLLVIIGFPFIGIFLFIVFGINRKEYKFYNLNFNAKRRLYDLNHKSQEIESFTHNFNSKKHDEISQLLRKSSGFPTVRSNRIELLHNGEVTFDKLFDAFSKAEKFIHIQYYIIENGELLDKLLNLFTEKIKSGVEIRILYDALGSYKWKNKSTRKLINLGAKVFPILPLKLNTILSTLNYRNHRKIAVIDGTIAFTGGVNISDKYIESKSELGKWDDTHLKIEGPLVDHIHRVFTKDYYFASGKQLLDDKYLPIQEEKGTTKAQVIVGGPDLNYHSILHQYTAMILSAEKSILIENPYFIPNQTLLEALKIAALRGVSISIMVPENNDSKIAKYSMYSNFESLLGVGIQIRILKNQFSHSKLIVIDEEIASVGSGNFDYRSFEHNYEINTLIFDNKLAKELAGSFNEKKVKCKILKHETFKNRSTLQKLLEGCAKILSPLL
ncbi:cardiolipin synthase [Tenacibaculum sp. MEBiC06402]|uniref:cardiolipin synthase n=1 Tax=unclassified Tenacibaculum TaxID=2635139 RepID=UPI003B9B9A34